MGCGDCGGDNNWDNCDALEIEKGTNRLPKKLIIQSQAEVAPTGSNGQVHGHRAVGKDTTAMQEFPTAVYGTLVQCV
jgi:hypothetical protein